MKSIRIRLGVALLGVTVAVTAVAGQMTRSLLVHPDEFTDKWIDRASSIGLDVLALHPVGGGGADKSLADLLERCRQPEFRARVDRAIAKGLTVEYEFHAGTWLLPRELFATHPEYFRMDETGKRVQKVNFCPSNAEALEIVARRARELARGLYRGSHRHYFWLDDVNMRICQCPKCRGYSDSDLQLIVCNRIVQELRKDDPKAQLAFLAYAATLRPPTKVKPAEGIFLEYAPIGRKWDRPAREQPVVDVKDIRALLDCFGRKDARVLEYWYDNSLFSRWTKPPKKFAVNADVMRTDVAWYRALGFETIASFACYLGDDYEKLWGEPDVSDFALKTSAPFTVDAAVPAGNVIVEKVEGDKVVLRQELRDTSDDWFYWAFRVKGAKGLTLTFVFDPSTVGGGPVGVRGPAVTKDGGKTWSYPCDGKSTRNSFVYAFDTDDEVRFYETWQYLPDDWEAFLAAHAADRGKKFATDVLCKSRKGRAVPSARFGCIGGRPKYRVFMSSRHHCSEATATPVLEGVAAAFLKDDALGRWLCANVELMVVPFVDFDGVIDGDQGKNRAPHDHNRDYTEFLYPETRAIRDWIASHAGGRLDMFIDVHCPWIRQGTNEYLYTPWKDPSLVPDESGETRFSELLEQLQCGSMRYRADDDLPFGKSWNTAKNYSQGWSAVIWACKAVKGLAVSRSYEVPFANARGAVVTPQSCRELGRDTAKVFREFFSEREQRVCIDGIYPHLAMSNDEGECGTGAVVPWAGSLWVITYGPHCPAGSSDKLYQITPDLKRVVRKESVGGTPANRLIHRETNQLMIGPYVIDAKGNVRTVLPQKMPGRLTGAARHLVDPKNLIYVATMDNGLYSLDMRTLAVKTIFKDHNWIDGKIWGQKALGPAPVPDWNEALENTLPGSHTKGMCTGFGRIQLSNNGEYSSAAARNPRIPSGVLGDCAADGTDQRVIRRNQFTDITTRDGIYGNEHPDTNPIWALGWDAKSVILAVATDGSQKWTYYRLPKGSHCYDGAHGFNTEWPRIREAGLGNGNLLATMHGTFWQFPKDFSPTNPNGIRPLSTYLKVIGDFCWWQDAPGGGSIVFGCDDHARSEFLGKRKLKGDQPKNVRSTSNLWFVKPEELTKFGPPSGEGWVWDGEDVKAGDVSDPYLWAGYAEREFTFVDAAGKPVAHELVHEGDWVRVKALADAKGVKAHFVYALPKPAKLPALDAKRPYIDITDDKGRTFRFPNVNGDTRVICREVLTERDFLYVGGVFYELPAENAGGFAVLRPIALADEPVTSIAVDRGFVVVNGKRMAPDALWRNGTAPTAYWLWRQHFKPLD